MRRVHGELKPIPAPELVLDYHRWMGGADAHDHLRMQRYSIQLCYMAWKYYKTLFLGFLDIALVNAFMVLRHSRKVYRKWSAKHYGATTSNRFPEALGDIEVSCMLNDST